LSIEIDNNNNYLGKLKPSALMGNSVSLEDELINLRLTSKAMVRSSEKCQKNAKAASAKVKKAIQQNNPDGARIYAQDAIREKNQALNCLRLASRIDAVSSRLDTAVRMNQLTISMGGVVKGMSKGLQAMDIDKLTRTMEKFEHQFDEWDIRTAYMEDTMNATTATITPAEQVDELIQKVADENSLELSEAFSQAGPVGKKTPVLKVQDQPDKDDLEARLANLRNA
jgi:charged multivesicular body protein 1